MITDTKQAYGQALTNLRGDGLNVAVVDIDLMRITGTKIFKEQYPDNHVNAGIAEQNAVAVAAGISLMGYVVFVTTFANFISLRAADQNVNTVCYNNLNVKLVGTYAGITSGKNGGTHISVMDVNVFRAMPNMSVIDAGDTNELM